MHTKGGVEYKISKNMVDRPASRPDRWQHKKLRNILKTAV